MKTSNLPQLDHLGGVSSVTGSAHLIRSRGLTILIDCGMAQGDDSVPSIDQWPVKPSEIDYLFITHAHIDHIGRVPELVRKGFRGEIICSHPTLALIPSMLEDAMGYSGMEDAQIGELVRIIAELTWGFEFSETFDLKNGIRFKLNRAGHILGSSFVRLESDEWSIIFSGDLGSKGKPILMDPDPPDVCDLLILESTYGDTVHEEKQSRIEKLGAVLAKALSDGGKVFIPSFALGRTQELIYELRKLASDPRLQRAYPILQPRSDIPVFVDSPLGLRLTEIYRSLSPFWDREAREILRNGGDPLDFEQLYAATRHEDHLRLLGMDGPLIVIAGSGMVTGGRIVDHLKSGIEDPRNDIVFVGYQGEGTPGRQIIECGGKPEGYVTLDGETFEVRAGVHVLTGYSAHADQKELIEWVQSMPGKPGRIRLVHGEPPARKALAEKLRALGYDVEY